MAKQQEISGKGFLVLIGVTHNDTEKEADYLVKKLCNLRVFEDENEKMNLGLKDVDGELLIISQFTLYADCTGGNRPAFINAARPEVAKPLYEYFCGECEKKRNSCRKRNIWCRYESKFIK